MKSKTNIAVITMCIVALLIFSGFSGGKKASVLVLTGGHQYNTIEFINMFESFEDMECEFVWTADMQQIPAKNLNKKYDAIVMMDMMKKELAEEHKQQYRELTRLGTGMVFLHFTLASRPFWDEYHEMVGGEFFLEPLIEDKSKASGFKTNVKWI